jgi:replication initiation protein RepC
MGNVEPLVSPQGAVRGLRKLTTNHLLAARLVERATGLPPDIRHPNQLLATLRRAAPYLGYHGLLPLMEALFRWTQPQDWEPGEDPIVWPGNEELANALGCSERHVSRLIAAAIEARLIAAKDGSDRRRRGVRQNGRILWAWGFNLRPMAARHAEFQQALEAGDLARRQCRALRREASAACQSLDQFLAFAHDKGVETGTLETKREAAFQLRAKLKRVEEPAVLEAAVGQLRALAASGLAWLEHAVESADMSGSADLDVRPILTTNQPTDPERTTVTASGGAGTGCGLPSPPLPAPPLEPQRPCSISAMELARLAPRLGQCLLTHQPDWGEVSDAAAVLAQELSIPRVLYAEACRALGRPMAAIAVAIISTKAADHFRQAGPSGYLRGMLRRAREGALHLDRSIFGLRSAAASKTGGGGHWMPGGAPRGMATS